MGRTDAGTYSAAVVDLLTPEFPELAAPETAAIVREAVARHATDPASSFEVILDSVSANWRLRADHTAPARVRLACFRPQQSAADLVREQRVNKALAQIRT